MESNAVISDIFIIDAPFSIRTKLEGDCLHHLMTGFTSPGQQHISGKIKHFVRLQPVGMWVGCPNSAHKYQNPIHSKSKEFHWRKEASSFASLEKGLAGLEGRTGQSEVRKGGKKRV